MSGSTWYSQSNFALSFLPYHSLCAFSFLGNTCRTSQSDTRQIKIELKRNFIIMRIFSYQYFYQCTGSSLKINISEPSGNFPTVKPDIVNLRWTLAGHPPPTWHFKASKAPTTHYPSPTERASQGNGGTQINQLPPVATYQTPPSFKRHISQYSPAFTTLCLMNA